MKTPIEEHESQEIKKEYPPVFHCDSISELKQMIYDGGWGDTGAYLFYQCKACGCVLKTRISDARTS